LVVTSYILPKYHYIIFIEVKWRWWRSFLTIRSTSFGGEISYVPSLFSKNLATLALIMICIVWLFSNSFS